MGDQVIDDHMLKETITPMVIMSYVQTLTCIVDELYNEIGRRRDWSEHMKKLSDEDIRAVYENFFIFAFMWSFGAPLD